MAIRKEITKDNELYLWMNGKLIYKRWLDGGYSKVFDVTAYSKYTEYSFNDFDLEETPDLIYVKANLRLYTTEGGGRNGGIQTGYRPNHVFEYQKNGQFEYAYMGDIQFEDREWIMPGESHEVIVRFLSKQPIDDFLNIGRKWWLHEGARVVGEAEMIEIELMEEE